MISRPLLRILLAGAGAEWRQLWRAPLLLVLVIIHALALQCLVMLFGLSGSRAPVAVVMEDTSALANDFCQQLCSRHHSFAVRMLDAPAARQQLEASRISAVITIPHDFQTVLQRGQPVVLRLEVDNVNADLSEDIRRALPSMIVAFTAQQDPGHQHLRLQVEEHDRLPHDTGFIPYLAVSALALDGLAISSVLSALVMIRDRENRMHAVWNLAPRHPFQLLGGRLLMAWGLAVVAMMPPLLVMLAVSIPVLHVLALAGALLVILCCGNALGVLTGVVIRHSALATTVILGLSLAVYLGSGAIEPQRFDGEAIWWLAHASPAYSAVGLLEYAVHDLTVTPEPLAIDAVALGVWCALAWMIAIWRFPRSARQ